MREGLTPILNKLINAYVSKYYIEKGASENADELIDKDQNIFTREYMKKNLFEEVKKEIIGIEKPVIEAQIKKDIEEIATHSRDLSHVRFTLGFCNSNDFSILEDKHYDILIPYFYDGKKYTFSLYSKGDLNVSKIAEKYNGGGHKNASGFCLDHLPFDILNKEKEGEI